MHIESFSYVSPGNPEKPCEDIVLLMPEHRCYAVFDGASSISSESDSILPRGISGGLMAAVAARRGFEAAIKSGSTLQDAANQACKHIRMVMDRFYRDNSLALPLTDPEYFWSCAVAAVQVNTWGYTILQVGDSCVVPFDIGDTFFPNCNHDFHELITINRLLREDPNLTLSMAVACCREPMLRRRAMMNYPGGTGYGALAPNGVNSPYCWTAERQYGIYGARFPHHIALLTDGMHLRHPGEELTTKDSYKKSFDVLERALRRGHKHNALRRLSEAVRVQERRDPEGIKIPRFKRHDDQAGILLQIT